MRQAQIDRKTRETNIHLALDLDGTGKSSVDTGVGFLDHMLELLSFHSGMDLTVRCQGDTRVDDHHSVEDIGLVKEFMLAFTRNAKACLHFHQLAGENTHHIIEAMFKGLGRALRQAVQIDPDRAGETPSSKGVL